MGEVIKAIRHADWSESRTTSYGQYENVFEGVEVETDQQVIRVGIESGQQCCENAGYLLLQDDTAPFVGAELTDVRLISVQDVGTLANRLPEIHEGDILFINIETSRGPLQVAVYNEHNGYYGHNSVVVSKQLSHRETL
jgi:hypothetical protein